MLRATNISPRTIGLADKFWLDQDELKDNWREKAGTFFMVEGPDGRIVKPHFYWGYHGEYKFWTTDENQWKKYYETNPKKHWRLSQREWGWQRWFGTLRTKLSDPVRMLLFNPPTVWLEEKFGKKTWEGVKILPGEEFTALGSAVAPYRKTTFVGLADARITSDSTPGDREALKKLAKIYGEELKIMAGGSREVDPYGPKGPVYPGSRVLDAYVFRKSGLHRIKAVYRRNSQLEPLSMAEELHNLKVKNLGEPVEEGERQKIIEKWRNMTIVGKWFARKERREQEHVAARMGLDSDNLKGFYIESNTVEFEVLP
ncbi:MAG: hypothetical protein HY927_11470 [Elusimicrobia bacterium]|nr:hypothetical protein [Elusimicrobiota bacterium]